jgi:hypothetical protein
VPPLAVTIPSSRCSDPDTCGRHDPLPMRRSEGPFASEPVAEKILSYRTTVGGKQGRLRLPPKAPRTAGPPGTRPGR